MCNVDTGEMGRVWYQDGKQALPFNDYNTRHKVCPNSKMLKKKLAN